MAQIPTSANINIASSRPSFFDLSCRHVCTTDFGVLRPLYAKMVVPADNFNIEVNSLTRLDAMPSPTMADIFVHQRAFYVPFRSICPTFNDFIGNTLYHAPDGKVYNGDHAIPYFTQLDINNLLLSRANTSDLCKIDNDAPDYMIYKSESGGFTGVGIRLLPRGRQFFAILHGLGYNFNFSYQGTNNAQTIEYSALPLLAFLKVFYDWYVPAKFRFTISHFRFIALLLNNNWNVPNNTLHTLKNRITSDCLFQIANFYNSFFTEDFFSNLTVEPFGNPTELVNVFSGKVDNPSGLGSPTLSETDGAANDAGNNFNYFTLQSIGVLQDMLNRNAIISDKLIDYLKSEFGIIPNTDALNLSHYLGGNTDTIHIGDVMSMSDTFDKSSDTGSLLGQYGGRGLGSQTAKFTCDAKEYGMILVLQDIVPKPLLFEGVHEHITSLKRTDFFTPEFDMLGSQPIGLRSINNSNTDVEVVADPNTIFGYAPQYAEYKCGFDTVSGNFRFNSMNTGLYSWYLGRNFANKPNPELENINFQDTSAFGTYNNFDDIFYTSSDLVDHFYQVHYIKVHAFRRMKQLIQQVINSDQKDNGQVEISRSGTLADRQ